MQNLRIYVLCSKIGGTSIQRNIQTSCHLLIRAKKFNAKLEGDVGLKRQKELYDDSESYEFTEEAEFESENLNLMQADKAYDAEMRERVYEKHRLGKIITAQKFFSPPPQPLMLTHREKECIKYLHKEDPEQWTVEALSESFPATPITIKKVLRKTWKPTPEKIKKMDLKVQKNWELLAQDKLEAEPSVLKHLKKFMNRRFVLLEQINEHKLYLSEPKAEPVWNGGEMTSILTSYEKQLKELEKENSKSSDNKMITEGSDPVKSDLDTFREEILLEKSSRRLERKESFILGETIKALSPQMTFEQLQDNILQKAEGHEDLSLSEKAILESKLGVRRNMTSYNDAKTESVNAERQDETKNDSSSKMASSPKVSKSILKMERSVAAFGKSKKGTARNEKYFKEKTQFIPRPDERTVMLTETNCENVNKMKKMSEPEEIAENPVVNEPKPDFTSDIEREERNKSFYEAIEKEISTTPFWNSDRTSTQKSLTEFEKADLKEPKDLDKVTAVDVYSHDVYPERIKIPKDKRGSGLTFKVNDCYYDDDGEFLYRVPGLK